MTQLGDRWLPDGWEKITRADYNRINGTGAGLQTMAIRQLEPGEGYRIRDHEHIPIHPNKPNHKTCRLVANIRSKLNGRTFRFKFIHDGDDLIVFKFQN